jgi:transposase-like protein
MRWTFLRKAELVWDVDRGRRSLEQVCREHDISPEEFASWKRLFAQAGETALKTTKLQEYREYRPARPRNAKNAPALRGRENPSVVRGLS